MTAISVRNLSKRYHRPVHDAKPPSALAKLLGAGLHMEPFWALRDLNFDVEEGDIVGFVGKNGAGKSTLLKIMSRITKPTEGSVRLRGRVGTLLEVGTGFQPEMTGRENMYMNGAILGMSRSEVRRKFDEIVAFAGVEDFIDMPVKRYSSGMYMRLAFAVAAHLDPDILIVDEVLAVGDSQFQKKCLEKVRQVSGQGRTVLFVSHNMETVQSLCTKALLLVAGRGGEVKDPAEVVHEYVRMVRGQVFHSVWEPGTATGDAAGNLTRQGATVKRAAVLDAANAPITGFVEYTDPVWFELEVEVAERASDVVAGMAIYDDEERLLYQSFHRDDGVLQPLTAGRNRLRVRVPVELLHPGQFRVKPLVAGNGQETIVGDADGAPEVYFDLQGRISPSNHWIRRRPGSIAPRLSWELKGERAPGDLRMVR